MHTRAADKVIALHCSGAGASQWRKLGEMLGAAATLCAPEHYGCESSGCWTGQHPFRLADEAARSIALIDRTERKVHLIGHSYGGGVALHIARARPGRIGSLTLYEPSAFFLLKQFAAGAAPYGEIRAIADAVADGIATGSHHAVAEIFIDYWGGAGAWCRMRPEAQDALLRWLPKVTLEFGALFNEPTPLSAFAGLDMPVLVMRGEHAPAPTKLIADTLASIIPYSRHAVIAGAGHMGPLTHAADVNAAVVAHIRANSLAHRAAA